MSFTRLPLRARVGISISTLMVLLSIAVGWALVRFERFFLYEEALKRVEALAQGLAGNVRDPLLAGDQLRLAPLIGSVMRDEDALYAYVADHRGTIVHHSNLDRIGQPSELPTSATAGKLEAAVPVLVEQTTVGTAVVALDSRFIDRAVRSTALGLLVPLGVGSSVGVAAMLLLAGHQVRRIERLEQGVRALGGGDLNVRVALDGNDEIGSLAEHFNSMVGQLHQARGELETNFSETTRALAAAIEAKDPYTRGHCERVAAMAVTIGNALEVDRPDVDELELAAVLHDIGKIGVPRDILAKDGPLDDEERLQMQRHPEIGAAILEPLSHLKAVGRYVLHHHEHMDGSGYPAGLAGEEIPLASRIINLVDAYDAMTSTRPYRSAMSHGQALRRITRDCGSQFDPRLAESFIDLHQRGTIDEICARVNAEYSE